MTFHSLAVRQVCVIGLSKSGRADPWQAMFHVLGLNPSTGKIVVAVDEDVNPRDWDSLIWTIAIAGTTAQRHADCEKPHPLDGSIGCSGRTGSQPTSG